MREAFFILIVVFILLALTAFRYRRQLAAAHQIWQMLRGNARGSFPINQAPQQKPSNEPTPLVKCARCGTWTPLDRSIRLNQNIYYCSSNCLENKAVTG
jgi:hypothetical protein